MKLPHSMFKPRHWAIFGAAIALIVALACSSDPAPASAPAIDETQLRNIVADAISQAQPAPQPQVSAQEIQSMVQSAVSGVQMPDLPEQVSASEIQSMVESAVVGAAAEGASPEQTPGDGRECGNGRDSERSHWPRRPVGNLQGRHRLAGRHDDYRRRPSRRNEGD